MEKGKRDTRKGNNELLPEEDKINAENRNMDK